MVKRAAKSPGSKDVAKGQKDSRKRSKHVEDKTKELVPLTRKNLRAHAAAAADDAEGHTARGKRNTNTNKKRTGTSSQVLGSPRTTVNVGGNPSPSPSKSKALSKHKVDSRLGNGRASPQQNSARQSTPNSESADDKSVDDEELPVAHRKGKKAAKGNQKKPSAAQLLCGPQSVKTPKLIGTQRKAVTIVPNSVGNESVSSLQDACKDNILLCGICVQGVTEGTHVLRKVHGGPSEKRDHGKKYVYAQSAPARDYPHVVANWMKEKIARKGIFKDTQKGFWGKIYNNLLVHCKTEHDNKLPRGLDVAGTRARLMRKTQKEEHTQQVAQAISSTVDLPTVPKNVPDLHYHRKKQGELVRLVELSAPSILAEYQDTKEDGQRPVYLPAFEDLSPEDEYKSSAHAFKALHTGVQRFIGLKHVSERVYQPALDILDAAIKELKEESVQGGIREIMQMRTCLAHELPTDEEAKAWYCDFAEPKCTSQELMTFARLDQTFVADLLKSQPVKINGNIVDEPELKWTTETMNRFMAKWIQDPYNYYLYGDFFYDIPPKIKKLERELLDLHFQESGAGSDKYKQKHMEFIEAWMPIVQAGVWVIASRPFPTDFLQSHNFTEGANKVLSRTEFSSVEELVSSLEGGPKSDEALMVVDKLYTVEWYNPFVLDVWFVRVSLVLRNAMKRVHEFLKAKLKCAELAQEVKIAELRADAILAAKEPVRGRNFYSRNADFLKRGDQFDRNGNYNPRSDDCKSVRTQTLENGDVYVLATHNGGGNKVYVKVHPSETGETLAYNKKAEDNLSKVALREARQLQRFEHLTAVVDEYKAAQAALPECDRDPDVGGSRAILIDEDHVSEERHELDDDLSPPGSARDHNVGTSVPLITVSGKRRQGDPQSEPEADDSGHSCKVLAAATLESSVILRGAAQQQQAEHPIHFLGGNSLQPRRNIVDT